MESTTSVAPKQRIADRIVHHAPSALAANYPDLSEAAKQALATAELPTTRQENWKYTRAQRLASENWQIHSFNGHADLSKWMIPSLNAHLVVFINGFFRKDLSSIDGDHLEVISISERVDGLPSRQKEWQHLDYFSLLHEVHCTDGIIIRVSEKKQVARPVHIIHVQTGTTPLAQPHVVVDLKEGSSLEMMMTFASLDGGAGFCNAVVGGNIAANASLDLTFIESEGEHNFLILRKFFDVHRDARAAIHTHTISGGWVRNDLHTRLHDKGADVHLYGTYLTKGKQFVDNHTVVDHIAAHCTSNELYKGVLNDQSKGVFNGKVFVRPDAQKTNAYQNNANILLSDDASIYTKPELEIYADDVKCSHGSTTGEMDEDALFYLRTRGLSQTDAQKLLTNAFVNEVLDKLKHETVRTYIISSLNKSGMLMTY